MLYIHFALHELMHAAVCAGPHPLRCTQAQTVAADTRHTCVHITNNITSITTSSKLVLAPTHAATI